MIWKSPVYRFRVPIEENSNELKEIVIDVTGSAPNFEDVKDSMSNVFEKLLESEECKNVQRVLDFGAAKLRNTFYFLNKGKNVAAVEFEELSKNSDQAKRILKKCQGKNRGKHNPFENWLFPYPFIHYNTEYDLALLINVLPVMPVFAERLMVLQTLYEKIKNDGYVLWYAQTEGSYKDKRLSGKYTCGDGIWTGITNYKKMFFRYHEVDEVDEMFALNGFDFVKKFHSPGNNVRLYKKNKYCLLKNNLTFEMISNEIPQDNSIKDPETVEPKIVSGSEKITEILPNPTKLSLANIYQSMLDKIPEGKDKDPKAPEIYHRVASLILSRVFRGSLSGMEIKRDKDNGLKVVDTVFKNKAKNGFFDDLANKFKILCPYIIVEAKNYSHDIKNQEFDQLSGRLDDKVGKFGIIVCRDAKNQEDIKSRCESYLNKGEYVIILTDNDLINLLDLYQDQDTEGINDYMDKKIRPLLFRSKK